MLMCRYGFIGMNQSISLCSPDFTIMLMCPLFIFSCDWLVAQGSQVAVWSTCCTCYLTWRCWTSGIQVWDRGWLTQENCVCGKAPIGRSSSAPSTLSLDTMVSHYSCMWVIMTSRESLWLHVSQYDFTWVIMPACESWLHVSHYACMWVIMPARESLRLVSHYLWWVYCTLCD